MIVECATNEGVFCGGCHHAKPHEYSPDCKWRMEAIDEKRRRICNCLNSYTKCKELREAGEPE